MAVEGRVNSSQALNQDCQEVLANKQSKGLLRCRILSIVVAVITFIAGVVLIALTLASIFNFCSLLSVRSVFTDCHSGMYNICSLL